MAINDRLLYVINIRGERVLKSLESMAINDRLLYEINIRGELVVVKSLESTQRAYLRFSNRTKRPVDIWWRDFQGKRQHYMRVAPASYYDVTSYITHPWEFTDASTNEEYYINNSQIFRAPSNTGGMNYRTNWNICIGMRTLRQTALMAVATLLPNKEAVVQLELPRFLQHELESLVDKFKRPPPVPGRPSD